MTEFDSTNSEFVTSILQQEKRCIFCGNKPTDKNKEHVIPRWLIALTGDLKRVWHLGIRTSEQGRPERRYSADQYTFPACEECNVRYSALEANAKAGVETLLADQDLTGGEWDNLLDWFDKVRIGLWIGNMTLNKDWPIPDPNFYIDQRLAKKDRLLLVYEHENPDYIGLNMTGASDPVFFYYPSTFLLVINQLVFVNASYEFMLSARMGFPYPRKTWYGKGEDFRKRFVSDFTATNNPRLPFLRFNFYPAKWAAYQSILLDAATAEDDYIQLIAKQYVAEKRIPNEPVKTLVCTDDAGKPHFMDHQARLLRRSQPQSGHVGLREHCIRLFEFRQRLLDQSLQDQPEARKIIRMLRGYNDGGIESAKGMPTRSA